jgi:hypothetical protein
MPESDHRSKFPPVSTPSDREDRPLEGYIRSRATHVECEWSFEVLSEQPRVGVVTIMTEDGPLNVGLNRSDAMNLLRKLQLFLEDWPEDQPKT